MVKEGGLCKLNLFFFDPRCRNVCLFFAWVQRCFELTKNKETGLTNSNCYIGLLLARSRAMECMALNIFQVSFSKLRFRKTLLTPQKLLNFYYAKKLAVISFWPSMWADRMQHIAHQASSTRHNLFFISILDRFKHKKDKERIFL